MSEKQSLKTVILIALTEVDINGCNLTALNKAYDKRL